MKSSFIFRKILDSYEFIRRQIKGEGNLMNTNTYKQMQVYHIIQRILYIYSNLYIYIIYKYIIQYQKQSLITIVLLSFSVLCNLLLS